MQCPRQFENADISNLPGLAPNLGLQFENLVLANRDLIIEALNIDMMDIVSDNPFFQTKTLRTRGCQVDYLIQTRQRTLYLCEIKFTRDQIKSTVINEVQSKIEALKCPKDIHPIIVNRLRQ